MLSLDPFVAGGWNARLPSNRYKQIESISGSGTASSGQTYESFYEVTSNDMRAEVRFKTQVEDIRPGWMAMFDSDADYEDSRTTATTTHRSSTEVRQGEKVSVTLKIVAPGEEYFSYDIYWDMVFGTFAVKRSQVGPARPDAIVSGTAVEPDGTPIVREPVTLVIDGKKFTTFTDERGRYAIRDQRVKSGNAVLTAGGSRKAIRLTGVEMKNVMIGAEGSPIVATDEPTTPRPETRPPGRRPGRPAVGFPTKRPPSRVPPATGRPVKRPPSIVPPATGRPPRRPSNTRPLVGRPASGKVTDHRKPRPGKARPGQSALPELSTRPTSGFPSPNSRKPAGTQQRTAATDEAKLAAQLDRAMQVVFEGPKAKTLTVNGNRFSVKPATMRTMGSIYVISGQISGGRGWDRIYNTIRKRGNKVIAMEVKINRGGLKPRSSAFLKYLSTKILNIPIPDSNVESLTREFGKLLDGKRDSAADLMIAHIAIRGGRGNDEIKNGGGIQVIRPSVRAPARTGATRRPSRGNVVVRDNRKPRTR